MYSAVRWVERVLNHLNLRMDQLDGRHDDGNSGCFRFRKSAQEQNEKRQSQVADKKSRDK